MSAASTYLSNEILDHILGRETYTAPSTLYFALYTTAPGDAGGGVECSGNGYSRVAVANNTTNFPSASAGQKSNGSVITFPDATGSWGTVVALGIFDAATGGNLLIHNTLTTAKAIAVNDTPKFIAGQFSITLD